MSRRDPSRRDALDDYVQRPPIALSSSEDKRRMAEQTLESNIGATFEPSPPTTDDDRSVEYGRTGAASPIHNASFLSYSAHPPPHNAADYDDYMDDGDAPDQNSRHGLANADDSLLGLTGLDMSKSSAGHHVSNVTLRAGFGGKAGSPTASNIAYEPSRDAEEIRKGGRVWAQNGTEVRDDTPRAARGSRVRLADALGSGFSPKRQAAEVARKRPLAPSSSKYAEGDSIASHNQNNAVPSETRNPPSPNIFSSNEVLDDRTSSGFSARVRGLRRDMTAARAESAPKPRTRSPEQATRATANHAHNKTGSIHLPDLTGLTSAVGTPSKPHVSFAQAQAPSLMEKEIAVQARRHREGEQRISSDERQLQRITTELEQSRRTIADLRDQLATRDDDHAGLPPRSNTIAEAETQLARATDRISQLEKQVVRLLKENNSLQSTVTSLRRDLARAREELLRQEHMLEELRASKHRDEEALREAKRAKDRHFQELRQKHEEIQQLQQDLRKMRAHCESLKTQVDSQVLQRQQRQQQAERAADEEQSVSLDNSEEDVEPSTSAWPAERRQLSAVVEEEEDDFQEEQDVHGAGLSAEPSLDDDRGLPDLSGGSMSSLGTPMEPPEPNSPRFNESFHNTSIVDSEIQRASPVRRKAQVEVEDQRSVRSSNSSHGSPNVVGQRELPEVHRPHQRPSSAPPLASSVPDSHRPKRRFASAEEPARTNNTEKDVPLPRPRIQDERVERLLHNPRTHDEAHCRCCRGSQGEGSAGCALPAAMNIAVLAYQIGKGKEASASIVDRAMDEEHRRRALSGIGHGDHVTVLRTKAIIELEDDFIHFRSVYTELAEQYGVIHPKNRVRRNILAEHLGEVITVLEKKGDLIAALYDLTA